MRIDYPAYYYFKKEDIILRVVGGNVFVYKDGEFVIDYSYRYMRDEYLENGELVEIDHTQAYTLINDIIIDKLLEKWNEDFKGKKEAWNRSPGWPAKLVTTEFILNDIKYTLDSSDVCEGVNYWEDGFMETIQSALKIDLIKVGASYVRNTGFLD